MLRYESVNQDAPVASYVRRLRRHHENGVRLVVEDVPVAQAAPESMVDAGGCRLRIKVRGAEGGTPLLLVNGLGAHLEVWDPVLEALGAIRTITFDAPGTGGSPAPRYPLTLRGLARVVVALLDELGADRVDVLGFSLGGAIAQEIARGWPRRVRRLVLVATSYGVGSVPGSPVAVTQLGNPLRVYSPRYFASVAPSMLGGRLRRDRDFVERYVHQRSSWPPSPLGLLWQLLSGVGWSSLPWLHQLTQPTLILAGDDDPLIPVANARIMAARIPDSQLEVVRRGGHLILLEEATGVLPKVAAFLDSPAP